MVGKRYLTSAALVLTWVWPLAARRTARGRWRAGKAVEQAGQTMEKAAEDLKEGAKDLDDKAKEATN